MIRFTDANGREWSGRLTLGVAEDFLAETGTDLLAMPENPESLITMLSSMAGAVRLLERILAPDDRAQFRDGLDGPTWRIAREALAREITDFSRPDLTEELLYAIKKHGDAQKRTLRHGIDTMLEAAVEAMINAPNLMEHVKTIAGDGTTASGSPPRLESPTTPP